MIYIITVINIFLCLSYMKDAPKVKPIYCHKNYNTYREHNNSIG